MTDAGRIWVDDYIGQENGFQPCYPTVVVEHRYVSDVVNGISGTAWRCDKPMNFCIMIKGGRNDGCSFMVENATRETAVESVYERLGLHVGSDSYESMTVEELPLVVPTSNDLKRFILSVLPKPPGSSSC